MNYRQVIEGNAQTLRQLHARLHETCLERDTSPEKRELWSQACAEFHDRYDELAFPGGFQGAYERILTGDEETIEVALCFVEVRPYFFRSGYIFVRLIPKLGRTTLTESQSDRFDIFKKRLALWRQKRKESR